MDKTEMEKLVSMVTQQVLAAVQQHGAAAAAESAGRKKILVVGCKDRLRKELYGDALVGTLEEYDSHRNILYYDKVVITKLSLTQLADIAQGRAGDIGSAAVVYALLSGVDVEMTEDALPYRKFAGKGSTPLYQMLEGYAQTLQVFGVKMAKVPVQPEEAAPKPPKFKAPAVAVPAGTAKPNASSLITEAEALRLSKEGGALRLPTGTIVTPSARDVFAQAGVELTWERG